MGSGKRLNDIENNAIKDLNLSISDISRRVNRSRKIIRRYLNDPESYGTKTSPRRPQNLSEHEKRVVLRESSKGSSSTIDLKNNLNLEVSRWTLFRYLQKSSFLKFVKRQHQPLLIGGSQEDPTKLNKRDGEFGDEPGLCYFFQMERN